MKAKEADILVLRGLGGGSDDYWYARWEARLQTLTTIEQDNWDAPDKDQWVERTLRSAAMSQKPIVFLAHSLGVLALVHAASRLSAFDVRGAFLVAPPDIEANPGMLNGIDSFLPIPRDPLPFPSLLVASRTDPYCSYDVADDYGNAWGSLVIDSGSSGHINPESGHGPWPEGLMVFARMMARF